MSEFSRPMERLTDSAREYLDLRVDDLKLRTAKGLSISLNHLLSMILVLFCAMVVLLALAFGCILLLGQVIGSYALGAFIVAALFAVLTWVLFRMRGKLFLDGFIKCFKERCRSVFCYYCNLLSLYGYRCHQGNNH